MAHHGQSDSYYNGHDMNQQYQPPPGPPQNYQQGYQPPPGPPQNYHTGTQPSYPPQTEPAQAYSQQPPTYGEPHFNAPVDSKQSFDQTFKIQKPRYNDIWAGLLMILVFFGFVAVSGITIQKYSKYKRFSGGGIYNSGGNDFSLNTNTLVLFAFVLAVALVFSLAYFWAARVFTKQFVWLTGILNCAFAVGTAAYYLYKHQWAAGIVFAIFAIFAIVCFISWIPRIPFAVVMLQTCMDVARKHGHVFIVSLVGGICSIAFAAWFSVTMVAIYVAYEPSNANANANPACANGGCSSGKVIGLIVFITFAGYWITEWLKNTIHTTIAGVYGTWYFCSGKPGGMPKGATRGAARRALTYSFGSISFGSLIVAIINMLRQACSIAQQTEAAQGNIVGEIMLCVLGCFIGLLDWAVQFVNRYAFSYIALYGKAYIPAAKETWRMMKDRGIDALINDCLTGPVLTMGSLFVAYLCALLSYLYLEFTKPAYNLTGTFTPVIMAYSFLAGLQICQVFLTPISSGIDTIFVAMAWDPQVLIIEHPDLWQQLVRVYPHVQDMIHA